MVNSLIFHPEAELEYVNSYHWYETQQKGLGKRFEEAVENRLRQIAMNPESYSFSKMNTREVAVESFPFTIIYQFSKKSSIVFILAIYHSRRNPAKKYRKF